MPFNPADYNVDPVAAFLDSFMEAANAGVARTALGLGSLATQSVTFGTGVTTALAANVGAAGAFITFNGDAGTPSSIDLTNGSSLPVGGINASGFLDDTVYLRGDGTWAAPPGGGGGDFDEAANYTPSGDWTISGTWDFSAATVTFGTFTVATLNVTKLAFSATLATDLTYNGTDIRGINAGATIAAMEAVYYDFTAGEWLLADANGTGTYPAHGLAAAASTDGAALTVITSGFVRNDAWNWSAGPIYISTTAGGLTQTAPSTEDDIVQPVGWAKSADIAYFHFNQFWATVGA